MPFEQYLQMMANSIFTGAGAAVGSIIANKVMERTMLKDIDKLIEGKLTKRRKHEKKK